MPGESDGRLRQPPLHLDPGWGPYGEALLAELAASAHRSGWHRATRTALRARSFAIRHVLTRLATRGEQDYAAVAAQLAGAPVRDDVTPSLGGWDPQWTVALGLVIGMQQLHPDDERVGARLLRMVHAECGWSAFSNWARLLGCQLLVAAGDLPYLRRALADLADVSDSDLDYVRLDARNPVLDHGGAGAPDFSGWLEQLNGVLVRAGSGPVTLAEEGRTPFDRLGGDVPARSVRGPLVSVVVTTYRPDSSLLTALRSIANQSWADLEILVVDDGSPAEFDDLLTRCTALDERIRLIRQPQNGGTYLARNAALDAARGEIIAGQDSDDWSHPRRIEWQIAPLLADPQVLAVQGTSVRANEDLVFNLPGYAPTRLALSTLMFRRRVVELVGYWDAVRKSADAEFLDRIRLTSPGAAVDLGTPLLFARLVNASLSRAEFVGGWAHETRRDYMTTYTHWHQGLRSAGSAPWRSADPAERTFPAPVGFLRRIPGRAEPRNDYDVLMVAGLRSPGASVRSVADELAALAAAGHRVGLAQLDGYRNLTIFRPRIPDPILDLVAAGTIDLVQFDQGARADLALVRSPGILICTPSTPVDLDVARVLVLANEAPAARDGTGRRYTVSACEQSVADLFGRVPLWVPQSPTVRAALDGEVDPARLSDLDLPCVLDARAWPTARVRGRGTRPVIGRTSADDPQKWPATARDILDAYPADGELDVRVRGGVRVASQVLGRPVPLSWYVVAEDEVDLRVFLNELDFFVYADHPNTIESVGRSVVEALATGCIPVLPPRFAATFGAAALYAEPADVRETVLRVWRDPEARRAQVQRGYDAVRAEFDRPSFVTRLARILAAGPVERAAPVAG